MSSLFRQEVLDRQSSKHLGDVFLASPPALLLASLLMAALFAGLLAMGYWGEYRPTYRAAGQVIELKTGEKVVQLRIVNTQDIPLIPGRKVRLFYDAYPRQSYGYQTGTVAEVMKPYNEKTSEEILITPGDWVGKSSESHIILISGMAVSAELPGEPVKIWRWVYTSMSGER